MPGTLKDDHVRDSLVLVNIFGFWSPGVSVLNPSD